MQVKTLQKGFPLFMTTEMCIPGAQKVDGYSLGATTLVIENAGKTSYCFIDTEGTSFCGVDKFCINMFDCEFNDDCLRGDEHCVPNSCCGGGGKCVTECWLGRTEFSDEESLRFANDGRYNRR